MLPPAPEGHDQRGQLITSGIVVRDRQPPGLQDPICGARVAGTLVVIDQHCLLAVSAGDSEMPCLRRSVIGPDDDRRPTTGAHSSILHAASDESLSLPR